MYIYLNFRTCTVELDAPFESRTIERNMPPLKFFYDMTFDLNTFTWVYGSSWEPILAQVFFFKPSHNNTGNNK